MKVNWNILRLKFFQIKWWKTSITPKRQPLLDEILRIICFLSVICGAIPSGTNIYNSIRGISTGLGIYNLGLQNYSSQMLPYTLNLTDNTLNASGLFQSYFQQSSKSSILPVAINQTVESYVLQKRKDDINNLVKSYFAGVSMSSDGDLLSFVAYYSSMAFHSSANLIHEISNILLAYYNSNSFQKTITTYNAPIAANSSLNNGSNDFLSYLACIDSFPLSLFNFLNSILIGLIISSIVMSIGKERSSNSKTLQLLSGTHYVTYWISNHIFDWLICIINSIAIVCVLKVVDSLRNDPNYETYVIANTQNLGYFFLLLFFSTFSWTTLAYLWSYVFRSEIVGFIVLLIVLSLGAFMDSIWTFLVLLVQTDASIANGPAYYAILVVQWTLTFLLPNITVKRGLYNFKIRDNAFCIDNLNRLLKSEY